MSTTDERARALVWAGGLLIQISRDKSLPLALRRQATVIARHFPTVEEIDCLISRTEFFPENLNPPGPAELEEWTTQMKQGPLAAGTRLSWPD